MRRLYRETGQWPDHDLRPGMEEEWAASRPAVTGPDSLLWTMNAQGEGGYPQVLEIEAGEEEQWRIITSALWAEITPREGKGPAKVEVRPNHNGLWRGQYYGTLAVENSHTPGHHHTIPMRLAMAGEDRIPAVSVNQTLVPLLDPGQELNVRFSAAGGRAPYQLKVLEELPAGFSFDAEEGRLTGKSNEPLSQEITIQVTDAMGARAVRRWMLSVNTPTVLPWRQVGVSLTNAFNQQNPCASPVLDKVSASLPTAVAVASYVGGVKYGDELIFEWWSPDSVLRSRMRYQLPFDLGGTLATRCIGSGVLPVAGNANASRSGEWTLKVLYNRHVAAERKFLLE